MSRLIANCLLFAAAFLWGLAFYFQKDAMAHIGPLTFVAARSLIATAALLPLALREKPFPPGLIGQSVLAGGAFFLAAYLQQSGLVTATVTNAGFLTAIYVVFTPLIAWALLRQPPMAAIWPAVALSFLGTWTLGGGSVGGLTTGDILVGASALFWALHVVLTSRASGLDRPFAFTCLQFAVVALVGTIGAAAFESPRVDDLAAAATSILYVGLVSSALTFTLLVVALRHTGAAEASVLLSMESVFAALAGAVLLHESLSPVSWAGAALILAAIVIVQTGNFSRQPATPASPASKSG
ncbi:MAG: DMT family transporter [Hyphomicrobiaceae bacterium]|nr:DMT family transporter [Hyphomicrobiaceae bacterium]